MQTQTHIKSLSHSEAARLAHRKLALFGVKSAGGGLGRFSGDRAGLTPNLAKDAAFCDNKAGGATYILSFRQRANARQKANARQREIAERGDKLAKRKTSRAEARNDASDGSRRARDSKSGFLAATILMLLSIFAILPCEALAAETIRLGESCKDLKAQGKTSQDGFFLIDPDGAKANGFEPFEVYCENMGGGYNPSDSSTFPVDYLPLPFQSDYSNFRFVSGIGNQYYRPARKEAIPMLPVAEYDRSTRSIKVNLSGKFISSGSGASFSNLNLQGTPFYIDRNKSSFSSACGARPGFTQSGGSSLILGMNDQIMKVNPAVSSISSCQPTALVLTQLNDYTYESDGNEEVRGNKIEVDCGGNCNVSKGAKQTGGKTGKDSDNNMRYSFESCKQLNENKHKGKLPSGHYYLSPFDKNSKRLTNLGKGTIEQRPFVAYCDKTTTEGENGGMMTMFIALDANETFNVADLLPREQDSCSQLGLAFFVPVTQPIFEDVRKQLLRRKNGSNGRAGWRDYLGSYNDMRAIFFPGKKYFVESIGVNDFWPYGPLGIYASKYQQNGKVVTLSPGDKLPAGTTLLGKEDCRDGGGTYDSACDVPMYSANYNQKSQSAGLGQRPRFVPGWTLGDRGFQSIFETLGIRENQYDRRYEKDPSQWGDVVTWWWASDFSCGAPHHKTGKIRPKKVFWLNKDLDSVKTSDGRSLRDLPPTYFVRNIGNYSSMPQTEPNGNYNPGDWMDYVADNDGNIFHCDDSRRYPLNDLPAIGDSRVNEAGYSYVHYTCLSKDSYTSMNFRKGVEIKGVNAWDGNAETHSKANRERASALNARLFTKEIGEPAVIRVGGIDQEQKFSAMMCSRIVEEVQGRNGVVAYNPISDWNASFSYDEAQENLRTNAAEGADFGQVTLFPKKAVKNARIETRYVLADVAEVDMTTIGSDWNSRAAAFANAANGGYKCAGNTDADFETPEKWSKFTNESTLVNVSLDSFAVKPRYFELSYVNKGGSIADTAPYLIAEVKYQNNPSALVSGVSGMTNGGFVLGAPIPTSANRNFKALGYNQNSASGAIVMSPAWNENLGQPNQAIIKGDSGANFVDGLSDLNITFADVGVFYLIVEDSAWTSADQAADCFMANDNTMPTIVKSGNAHYINTANRPESGRNGSSDREADYKIGCSIGGAGVINQNSKFVAGATRQLLRSGLSRFAVTDLNFSSPLVFSNESDKNMWAYYSGTTNESAIKITGRIEALGAAGGVMRNYTEGNYSLPTRTREEDPNSGGLYFVVSGKNTSCANRKDLFCELIYPNTNEWYFSQKNINDKDWDLGKADLNTMWNFTRRTTPMLPTHLKAANEDFNVTIVEDNRSVSKDRQINEKSVTGGITWNGKEESENRTKANVGQITFVYGRANVHDVVSYTEEAYLTYSIDYYNPSDSSQANAGFNHPLPSTASTGVGSAGWARIVANSGSPKQAFDGTSEANFSVQVESKKVGVDINILYSPYAGGKATATNIKLHEQKGVAASGSKDFRVEYKDGMQDRKRDFISHLSVPTYLWYRPSMKPYKDIRLNMGTIGNNLSAYEHPTGKVTFLKPERDKWIGMGETQSRYFKDDANESKVPQRVWW